MVAIATSRYCNEVECIPVVISLALTCRFADVQEILSIPNRGTLLYISSGYDGDPVVSQQAPTVVYTGHKDEIHHVPYATRKLTPSSCQRGKERMISIISAIASHQEIQVNKKKSTFI